MLLISSSAPADDQGDKFRKFGELIQKGFNALMIACSSGDVKLAREFLDEGQDVNHKSKDGATALMLAVTLEKPELVDLLIDRGADVNTNDSRGYTPLMFAAYYGRA